MNTTYNVLIIDDHPSIIDAFKNALNFITEQSDKISFNTSSALDCKTAYAKIKDDIKVQNLDLIILDLSLPPAPEFSINSGKDLGLLIQQSLPKTKILVCTFFSNSLKLRKIIEAFNPFGFINKNDVGVMGFVSAINNVLANKRHYSQTIINTINQKEVHNILLDEYDILILKELANGAKMKDLLNIIHLSKSAIDKRKRLLKRKFNIDTNSDRDLVLTAKAKGYI